MRFHLTKDQRPKSKVHFQKMHGAGNDFVVLDARSFPLPEDFNFAFAAQKMCARNFGIGGDGLLLLDAPSTPDADLRMRMWNPDGSEDMCGNGLRCIARLAFDANHVSHREFVVETLAGLRACRVLPAGDVRIEMGAPEFDFAAIPMQPIPTRSERQEYSLSVGGREFPHTVSLSTGSTHTVIFLNEDLSEADFQTLSPQIEHHEFFPERTSVLWARVVAGSTLRLRIWERGVGETLACGTGACAAAVAAIQTRRADGIISVQSKGGVLQIEWDAKNSDEKGRSIWMTGPTATVFDGSFVFQVSSSELDESKPETRNSKLKTI